MNLHHQRVGIGTNLHIIKSSNFVLLIIISICNLRKQCNKSNLSECILKNLQAKPNSFLGLQIELANKVPNFQNTLWKIISFISFSIIVQVYYLAEYSGFSLLEDSESPPPPLMLFFFYFSEKSFPSSSLDCTNE